MLLITLKIEPFANVDKEKIKKEIENQVTNLPAANILASDRSPLARILEVKVMDYEKELPLTGTNS